GVYFNFVIGIVSQNIDSPTNPVRFNELDSNNKIVNHHTAYNSGMIIPVSTKAAILKVKCKD
ncbi:hypothetical protein KMP96_13835, partial [Acinetobacter baumannii]|nr:hypothetical protein [Acinetobacter baumannii]